MVPLPGAPPGRPLAADEFLRAAISVAGSLAAFHRQGAIYGRIGPAAIAWAAGDAPTLLPRADDVDPAATSLDPGQVPYLSPEQTGRIARPVDHRSDLYSLGALFYEWLAGAPPFPSDDPLKVLHAHIARTLPPPGALRPDVPEQLSAIVLRLLAKEADDRYQSAEGLRRDLERADRALTTSGTIDSFPPGQDDVGDRLMIPRRLYGRDDEARRLLDAFDAACGGSGGLVLVGGYSGIGKTSLIRELYQPMTRERGYFISGKADQVMRTTPYAALLQAFRGLLGQWLAEPEERLAGWRQRILSALGANGGVLTDVLPDIELIIGPQTPPPPLDPPEAQNRFRYVLQNFVRALAQPEHPLVIVLDDLQWADLATLDLLQTLVGATGPSHLLVVGAYRDNEVGPDHPLTRSIGQIEASGGRITRVQLAPLSHEELAAFLSDTLRADRSSLEPFVRLIRQKTGGNPFFVIQFLRTLEQRAYFSFDYTHRRWTFDLDAIAGAATTDNVIDLMTQKIRWLSPGAQTALRLAACIGNRFTADTLLMVSRLPAADIAAGLTEACDAGLVERQTTAMDATGARPAGPAIYTFLHDQVQQAAYGLIPDDEKAHVHLDVGRLLLSDHRVRPSEDRLFDVVNHLNVGRPLITDRAERRTVAELNLAAGRKARASAAHQSAADHFDAGLALVDADDWATAYDLVFALHLEAAESRSLVGAFDRAEQEFSRLLSQAASPRDQAVVHELRIKLYENQSRWTDAVEAARAGLALFGIVLPDEPGATAAALDREVDAAQAALGSRTIASLMELPGMSDPDMRLAMRILTTLWASAYISGNQTLARLVSATLVRLSLEHGHTADSAYGYVTHAITIGPIRGDYEQAYEWGELALRVNEHFNDVTQRARIHQQFQAHVNLWRRPFETCLPHAREASRSGLEAGDFAYAGYGAATEAWAGWLVARNLEQFVRDFTPHLDVLGRVNLTSFRDAHQMLLNWARALLGQTATRTSLDTEALTEAAYTDRYGTTSPFFMMFPLTARLHLHLLFNEDEAALAAASAARAVSVEGIIWPVLVDYWAALARASLADGSDPAGRDAHLSAIVATREQLATLARHCPENFKSWWLLVAAEVERLENRTPEAARLYQQAIDSAAQAGRLPQEALAAERCARFWLSRGQEALAAPFLRDARRGYDEWGAVTKVRQLEAAYGRLLDVRRPAVAPPAATATGSIDTSTVLKVAHAIAREVELDGLLRRLIELAVENAGAERGVFLQPAGDLLLVQAEASTNPRQVTVRQAVPLDDVETLPHRVIRYVHRTGQHVVLGEASSDERFAGDPHLTRAGARSILCTPVSHQGRLGGILYLENTLTSDAFTPARLEMMGVLAAQAAISLENARLYEGMRSEIDRRTVAEEALRSALDQVETLKNRLEVENVYLQEEIRTQHNFDEIIGTSPVLLDALRKVERVAPTESTVLIVGETGTGKELVARAVHHRSRRAQRPLVKVNCGAIPPGLVESELFGHVKGAFTGALDKRVGRFEVANGGTIFLDEVGELPAEAQVKLLRVLQEQEFEPVGSSRTVRVDIRVIAATNRDLAREAAEGRFRPDLLYRLNVFPIEVPPLRERRQDIPVLVAFLAASLARKLGKPIHGVSTRSMTWMMAYDWPGNVRELQNLVERAAILAQGPVLEVEGSAAGGSAAGGSTRTAPAPSAGTSVPAEGTLDDVQRAHILAVLGETNGVIEGARGAASRLGLHPNTLRSRLKKLGIPPATVRPRPRQA